MYRPCADADIEQYISKHKLDPRAAGLIRSLPHDDRRQVLTIPLDESLNGSSFVINQLQKGLKLTHQMPRQSVDHSAQLANFGGGLAKGANKAPIKRADGML